MDQQIEITSLDLRYQGFRTRNRRTEARLLDSIARQGIQEPLEGVDLKHQPVLLDGFKRYRCARKLHLSTLPYRSLGQDEIAGIRELLKLSTRNSLSLLEQAAFVAELHQVAGLSTIAIAEELSVSKGWVGIRLGLIESMSPKVRRRLFDGSFPVYAYMYTLRPFMRMNEPREIESFMEAVCGQGLSLREIEQLAHGYFRGPETLRKQILEGHFRLPLQQMKQAPADPEGCDNDFERGLLGDLERIQKYMQRIGLKSRDRRIVSRAFHAQSHLLTTGILSRWSGFIQTIRELHDRNRQA